MGIEILFVVVFGLGFYSGYQAKEHPELPKNCYEIIIKDGRITCFKEIYENEN